MIIFFIFLLSLCFSQMFHPVAMLISLILMTGLIVMNLTIMACSWLSYILLLIMLGGLHVLFVYIISLTPNNKMIEFSLYSLFLMTPLLMIMSPCMSNKNYHLFNNFNDLLTISKMFYPTLMNMIIIISFFLLFALLVIVYIAQFNKGALRSSYGKINT